MSKIAPNPYSPYADADPQYRHLVEVTFFGRPPAGALVPAACERMTVVPEELTEAATLAEPPEGLCPVCVTVMQGGARPRGWTTRPCGDCGLETAHDGLCAVCRSERHDEWWPTRHAEGGGRSQRSAQPAGYVVARDNGHDGLEIAECWTSEDGATIDAGTRGGEGWAVYAAYPVGEKRHG